MKIVQNGKEASNCSREWWGRLTLKTFYHLRWCIAGKQLNDHETAILMRNLDWISRIEDLPGCLHLKAFNLTQKGIKFSVWSDGSIKGFLSTSKVSREVATVEICVLCCCWFWNQFDMVSETPYSCETIGRELYWAILCLLLCTESAWNIRGHVLILTDFKKWSFDVSFLASICLHNYFKTEKKLNFLNKLTLQKFWLLDLLNSRQSRTSFVFGLVSLNCWLRLLEYFSWVIF